MLVTLLGIVMLARLMQLTNAESPMATTLSGIVTLAKRWHPTKVALAMLVTRLGIVMLVRLVQPWNAK